MSRVALALGANLGDRLGNLRRAVRELTAAGWTVERASDVFETPPFGDEDQPPFLNACLVASVPEEDPEAALRFLKDLEGRMGRIPRHRNGPREIDLDLLFWDDRVLQTPALTLPHPGIPQRAFVLVPLLQVAADWVHPALRKTVAELARDVSSEGIVRIVSLS